jgi:hypothetical protein
MITACGLPFEMEMSRAWTKLTDESGVLVTARQMVVLPWENNFFNLY